jgi:hypothetical protein
MSIEPGFEGNQEYLDEILKKSPVLKKFLASDMLSDDWYHTVNVELKKNVERIKTYDLPVWLVLELSNYEDRAWREFREVFDCDDLNDYEAVVISLYCIGLEVRDTAECAFVSKAIVDKLGKAGKFGGEIEERDRYGTVCKLMSFGVDAGSLVDIYNEYPHSVFMEHILEELDLKPLEKEK